jgi:hypothetical protein
MTIRPTNSRERGGVDPLDSHLPRPVASRLRGRLDFLLRSRAALGLRPVAAPVLVFVPLGVLLGPQAANILSSNVLAHLDTVVSIALAALGVFVGVGLDLRGERDRRLFAAASTEAMITILVVSIALMVLLTEWGIPVDPAAAVVAVALGVCASASSAGVSEASDEPVHRVATRVADLDDVLPIVLGGVVLVSIRHPDPGAAFLMTGITCLVGLAIGVAGWLLFEAAVDTAERGVFVLGVVILLGGSAAYLSLSPLLAGMVAGIFWTLSPGRADQIIRGDLRKIQHPLVVLLLLTAGATLEPTRAAVWLLAPFVLFRFAGKLLGGFVASRVTGRVAPSTLGAYLIPPGVIGIAFALNFQQVAASPTGVAILTATALGALAAELLALVALPAPERD